MKKTILALLALGAFGMANAAPVTPIGDQILTHAAGVAPGAVGATHAKITVIGKVLDNTCEIKTDDREKTVTLRDVGKNQLTALGDVAADQLIEIHVEKCKAGTTAQQGSGGKKVSAAFRSTNNVDHVNNGTLKNLESAPTAAKFVNIQFSNLDGSSIRLGANDSANTLKGISATTTGEGVIQFNARYYATGQSVPGTVKAEAELDLAYE
ncbi:type 1 fimbrial protein [Haemophilus influenzae]|nr:type 1 fimbrial protein [Haemophilus influenzae]